MKNTFGVQPSDFKLTGIKKAKNMPHQKHADMIKGNSCLHKRVIINKRMVLECKAIFHFLQLVSFQQHWDFYKLKFKSEYIC